MRLLQQYSDGSRLMDCSAELSRMLAEVKMRVGEFGWYNRGNYVEVVGKFPFLFFSELEKRIRQFNVIHDLGVSFAIAEESDDLGYMNVKVKFPPSALRI